MEASRMSCRRHMSLLVVGLSMAVATLSAQAPARPDYDVAFIGPPLADPVMQHNKETYVLFGCAYCHGVNLVPRGEAADLRQSPIVGGDVHANLIGRVLRTGIPQTAKLSPMPQFSDLSDQQINAIAEWIHYARRQARYAEVTAAGTTAGTASAGKAYFDQNCASCHGATRDLSRIGAKYDAEALRVQVLEPKALNVSASYTVDRLNDMKTITALDRHHALLENFVAQDVSNLVAYLQTLK